jgi:hypothetical protein
MADSGNRFEAETASLRVRFTPGSSQSSKSHLDGSFRPRVDIAAVRQCASQVLTGDRGRQKLV